MLNTITKLFCLKKAFEIKESISFELDQLLNLLGRVGRRLSDIGEAEGASVVQVLAGSTVDGSIHIKQGGAARVENVIVNGDLQFESNNGALSAARNQVGGNVQVFQNVGGTTIADNTINGNLQCKENNPAPAGGNNLVQGNK